MALERCILSVVWTVFAFPGSGVKDIRGWWRFHHRRWDWASWGPLTSVAPAWSAKSFLALIITREPHLTNTPAHEKVDATGQKRIEAVAFHGSRFGVTPRFHLPGSQGFPACSKRSAASVFPRPSPNQRSPPPPLPPPPPPHHPLRPHFHRWSPCLTRIQRRCLTRGTWRGPGSPQVRGHARSAAPQPDPHIGPLPC